MTCGFRAIHVQIPGCFGEDDIASFEYVCNFNLTPQSTCWCEPECQIEQILFLINGRLQFIINILGKYNMTCRACKTGLTGTFQLNIILLSYFKNMLSLFCHNWFSRPIPSDERESYLVGETKNRLKSGCY